MFFHMRVAELGCPASRFPGAEPGKPQKPEVPREPRALLMVPSCWAGRPELTGPLGTVCRGASGPRSLEHQTVCYKFPKIPQRGCGMYCVPSTHSESVSATPQGAGGAPQPCRGWSKLNEDFVLIFIFPS